MGRGEALSSLRYLEQILLRLPNIYCSSKIQFVCSSVAGTPRLAR